MSKPKETETETATENQDQSQAIATHGSNVPTTTTSSLPSGSGSLDNALDFQRALQAVSAGFDNFDKVADILESDASFNIIDAYLVRDFVDQSTGETADKVVWKLELQDSGEIKQCMQSDSGVRRQIVNLFERGRIEGYKVELRNYKFKTKPTGKPSPAIIFDDTNREIFINGQKVLI